MKGDKRFIIRKYIMAQSCQSAIRKERRTKVDDCWVDDEWKKENPNQLQSAIGFEIDTDEPASGLEAKKKR